MEEVNKTVWVHFFGKKYQVPTNFTIMGAMEWVGYQLRHGCGCRGGKCGACACLYRIDGKKGLHGCLACQTMVQEGMFVVMLPFFPLSSRSVDIRRGGSIQEIISQLYPEVYHCVGCNACSRACTQELNPMHMVAMVKQGRYLKCAEESLECVMCGVCASRCPAEISHPQVFQLVKRLAAMRLVPPSDHLEQARRDVESGKWNEAMDEIMAKSTEELKELYCQRNMARRTTERLR